MIGSEELAAAQFVLEHVLAFVLQLGQFVLTPKYMTIQKSFFPNCVCLLLDTIWVSMSSTLLVRLNTFLWSMSWRDCLWLIFVRRIVRTCMRQKGTLTQRSPLIGSKAMWTSVCGIPPTSIYSDSFVPFSTMIHTPRETWYSFTARKPGDV
ncbi:hypothetical protein BDV93DRAFT_166780 [Ceratobasidium sp. AG-I]|nr:hypothetical protein BDV93DRAFT_166780 [Ceratobasidium sp. AG-I]